MPTIEHSFFGNVTFAAARDIDVYGDLCDLRPISFRGETYPAMLYYTPEALVRLTPQILDGLAALAGRLDTLDEVVRTSVPDELRLDWLSDRMDATTWASADAAARATALLRTTFPDAPVLTEVTAAQFSAALKLHSLMFSLAPDGDDASALTVDYRVLPDDVDDYLFAAKFAVNGDLLSIAIES
jgi:hypothetical protein